MAKKAVIQNSILTGGADLGVAPGADVEIRTPAGALASLWTDRDGTTGKANPFTADANGFFRVYATPGRYKITATEGAEVQIFEDVVIKARIEPELPAVAMGLDDNASQPQTLDIFNDGTYFGGSSGSNVIQFIWTDPARVDFDPSSRGLLVLGDAETGLHRPADGHIEITAGPPGFVEVSYSVTVFCWDVNSNVAALTGDEMEVYVFLRTLDGGASGDPVLVPESRSLEVARATTGFDNLITLTGHALIAVAADAAQDLALMIGLQNQSDASIGLKVNTAAISIRRYIDEDD